MIISDQPLPTGISVKAMNHYLGESGVTFFVAKKDCDKYQKNFPDSLHLAPFLMPSKDSAQYQRLVSWFDQSKIAPKMVAEFDDSALLKFFGQTGRGLFCVSTAVERDVLAEFDVSIVGRVDSVFDRYYGILPERKFKHAAVDIVLQAGKKLLTE